MLCPATAAIRVVHDRIASPSTCTVQAPQSACPQPNFVPVNPSVSRSTQSNGVSAPTSTECCFPFTVIAMASIACAPSLSSSARLPSCAHFSPNSRVNFTFRPRQMQFVFVSCIVRRFQGPGVHTDRLCVGVCWNFRWFSYSLDRNI